MNDFYPFTVGVRSPIQILSELLSDIITCITKV